MLLLIGVIVVVWLCGDWLLASIFKTSPILGARFIGSWPLGGISNHTHIWGSKISASWLFEPHWLCCRFKYILVINWIVRIPVVIVLVIAAMASAASTATTTSGATSAMVTSTATATTATACSPITSSVVGNTVQVAQYLLPPYPKMVPFIRVKLWKGSHMLIPLNSLRVLEIWQVDPADLIDDVLISEQRAVM